jgi:hypothetical protein
MLEISPSMPSTLCWSVVIIYENCIIDFLQKILITASYLPNRRNVAILECL